MDQAMDQVRAWKDPAYRATLSEAQRAQLASPVPPVDLKDPSLRRINGGRRDTPISWCLPWRCT
jgi:mersacidin/lichenicidin family type 2 lantibiotic